MHKISLVFIIGPNQFHWWRKPEYLLKTIELSQVTDCIGSDRSTQHMITTKCNILFFVQMLTSQTIGCNTFGASHKCDHGIIWAKNLKQKCTFGLIIFFTKVIYLYFMKNVYKYQNSLYIKQNTIHHTLRTLGNFLIFQQVII